MAPGHRFAFVLLALAAFALLLVAVRFVDRVRDRRAAERLVDGIVADAQAAYAAHVQRRADAALLDEFATEYPMRQRPSVPAAGPGEPWQLRRDDAGDFPAGLVEQADLTDTLDGENR